MTIKYKERRKNLYGIYIHHLYWMRHSTQVKLETFLWHELLCESVLFLNIHLLFIFLWDCEFYDFLKNIIVGPDMGWKFGSNFEYESSEDWENWAMGEKKASRERKSNRRASPGEIIKMGEKKRNGREKRKCERKAGREKKSKNQQN